MESWQFTLPEDNPSRDTAASCRAARPCLSGWTCRPPVSFSYILDKRYKNKADRLPTDKKLVWWWTRQVVTYVGHWAIANQLIGDRACWDVVWDVTLHFEPYMFVYRCLWHMKYIPVKCSEKFEGGQSLYFDGKSLTQSPARKDVNLWNQRRQDQDSRG